MPSNKEIKANKSICNELTRTYYRVERYNCRPRKDDMIPFPFKENRFSFFVADHLLVGQLCTNPNSDKSLLSCLKVTQCSMSEIGDAPLYNSCSLPIQVMTTGPLPAHSKCKSGRFNAWGHSSTHRKTLRTATVMVFDVVSSKGHTMPPHIFDVGLKINTKVYLDVQKCVVITWCNQVAGGRPWVLQQDSTPANKSKETQAWLQKQCNDFVPFSHWPPSSSDLNPLDYFVWSYVENITNMTSHNTKASLIAAICRVFAELPPTLLEKACSQFRIEAVIEVEGGYIEYMSALLHNQVTWIVFFFQ